MIGVGAIAGKTESIRLQKGVSIYKQPLSQGRGSPNWYARVYLSIDGRNIHTRTTRTTDQKLAEMRALEFFGDCLLRRQMADGTLPVSMLKGPTSNLQFDRIVDRWLDQLKFEAGDDDRQVRHWKDYRGAALGYTGFAKFFGKVDINTITTDKIREFVQHKHENSRTKKLAGNTIKRNLVALNVLLNFAFEQRLLISKPNIPKVKSSDNPRPWFEHDEYRRLHIAARAKAKKCKLRGDSEGHDRWNELSDFIIFMVGSFLRPSEWTAVKHGHVTSVENAANPHLSIAVVKSKTRPRTTVTMQTALTVYRRIVRRNGRSPDKYLFKPQYLNRQTAQERMADDFRELLRDTGLEFNKFGNRRVMYSLRHTALMLRFTMGENPDILALAKNAGTSIDQLERFYLKRINPADKIANLQSVRKTLGARKGR